MRDTRLCMGMPVEITIVGGKETEAALEDAFAYLAAVDERFSTYKEESEISRLNRGEMVEPSAEMCEVLGGAEEAKCATKGYFDIKRPDGKLDPSGFVKGWAIKGAAARITSAGHKSYFVNAGGDIAMAGKNEAGEEWSVGIRNPFKREEVVKVVFPKGKGIATSGSYTRGAHIYNPHHPAQPLEEVVSVTVIAPDVLRADVLATAAFAMGKEGIVFLEEESETEGYQIDAHGTATFTSGFAAYTHP